MIWPYRESVDELRTTLLCEKMSRAGGIITQPSGILRSRGVPTRTLHVPLTDRSPYTRRRGRR